MTHRRGRPSEEIETANIYSTCSNQNGSKWGLNKTDLENFHRAIKDDYGLELNDGELYNAAHNLLSLFKALVKFDKEDKDKENDQKVLKPS